MSAITRRVFLGSGRRCRGHDDPGMPCFSRHRRREPRTRFSAWPSLACAGRGNDHVNNYAKLPGVEVAALCDVDRNVLEAAKARGDRGPAPPIR